MLRFIRALLEKSPWLPFSVCLAVLTVISAVVLKNDFDDDLSLARDAANNQLQLISRFASLELNLGNYQNIKSLFRAYAEANNNIVELHLVAPNQFHLADYVRTSTDRHILELRVPIEYGYRDKATLLMDISLEPVYQYQEKFIAQFAVIFLVFAAMSTFLLYFALRSKRDSLRARQMGRLYKALSEINQAIVRMEREEHLFPLVCRCAVEFGGMSMAWVARPYEQSSLFFPAASYGSGQDYLEDIVVSSRADVPEGRGQIGIAYRENRPCIVNDYFASAAMVPWKKQISRKNWQSGAAFPIMRGGKPYAVLSVYHLQAGAFDRESIELLDELSKDVSFALDNFDREVRRKAAEHSLRMAASIYENSSEGMMITDGSNLIQFVNPAFTMITGYSMEEVIGKPPGVLKSGRHEEAFYQSMWDGINATGKWSGEIWDRRKNGEEYPKWLTIDTVFDDDGQVSHRIAIFSDISQKKKSDELIWEQANFDSLTGLPNRRLFLDRLEQEIKKIHRTGRSLALFFLDLDHFKEVNDTLGHAKGDILLAEVARRIGDCVRETDTVARLGGDEFTLILPEFGEHVHLERIAQDILHALSVPIELGDGNTAYTGASIGIALYPNDAGSADELMKHADQAMYAAKMAGRNRFGYFTRSMQIEAQNKLELTTELRFALTRGEMEVYYQPIIDLASGRIEKAEALLRWHHPLHGMISPAVFIPLAEEFGLIHDIGDWVFTQAVSAVSDWRRRLGRIVQVSVNRSPLQFDQDATEFMEVISTAGLPGSSITIEITEGLLLKQSETVNQCLLECRTRGIEVSIDDFGTGFSSLSYLKQFDIDYLKIDRSFVNQIIENESDRALTEAIIVMAHKLGIKTIAEGVETQAQRDLLVEFGCDYAQGNFYSVPVPEAQFERMLEP